MNACAAVGDDEEALWRLQRGRVVVVVSDSTIMIPFLLSFCTLALAGNSSGLDSDPYLQYRPAFARSLPVQILLTGVVLTLVAVLFIHLIFTAQYHWPLAPVNYVLQLSGVISLLISLIATIHVVLSATANESGKWPYMLSYIAVNTPPLDRDQDTSDWSVAERATWLVMNASTSGLIQITHIQFLTLLYPSRLEGRLIFTLLGPLAIVAAVMQLLPINDSASANLVASAVKNVCNATLSLLFTASLFIWGFLVNRKQAWRTDGGTAAFGCAALSLAVVSTALNFLYVPREEEYVWLPSLMWAVILWQSFLGWWWWVGAGSASGLYGEHDIEEKLIREAKRESRRREGRERRKETKQKAKKVWKGVAGAFVPKDNLQQGSSPQADSLDVSTHSLPGSPTPSAAPASFVDSGYSAATFTTLPRHLPAIAHRWYASLRRAHVIAAQAQAAERVERLRELDMNGSPDVGWFGWSLGSFGRVGRSPVTDRTDREFELYDRSDPAKWRVNTTPQLQEHRTDREQPRRRKVAAAGDADASPTPATQLQSVWWWGPLARWRLQDSTVY